MWYGSLSGGEIDLSSGGLFAESNDSEREGDDDSDSMQIHSLISTLAFDIRGVDLKLDDQMSISVEQLSSSLNSYTESDSSELKQTVKLDIVYGNDALVLPVRGYLESTMEEGVSTLALFLDELDLNKLPNRAQQESKADSESRATEGPMDWGWLAQIDPVQLKLNIERISVDQSNISNISALVRLHKMIEIRSLNANVDTVLNDQFSFKSKVDLSGDFTPLAQSTDGKDIKTKMSGSIDAGRFGIEGEVDLNSLFDAEATIALELQHLPIQSVVPSGELDGMQQYFPLDVDGQISISNEEIEIPNLEIKAGISELNASIGATLEQQKLDKVTIELDSPEFSFQEKGLNASNDSKGDVDKNSKLFSSLPITWPWSSGVELDARFAFDKFTFNQFEFSNLRLPLSMNSDSLSLDHLSADFSGGELLATLSMQEFQEEVSLNIDADAKNIKLDLSGLLPADQIAGGEANATIELSSRGNTTQQIADAVTGNILVNLNDAKVNNSSLNLIGSDILLETIHKLNPFAKSDPFTEVDCVVIHGNADKGVIEFKKSLVLETNKMAVVGTGNINLSKESIDIRITPKAHGGVGLNAGSVLKLMEIGGSLSHPKPVVSAGGLLKTGVAIGAAMSTGGVSLLADGFINKAPKGAACERALNTFSQSPEK